MTTAWIRRLTEGLIGSKQPVVAVASTAGQSAAVQLRYPPSDSGFPLLGADEILAANSDLIQRLKLHAAVSEPVFQARFLDPLRRLADHLSVMPATAANLFSGEMGLFRAALESGFYCFQASDGRIFTGSEGVERRHALETRWRYLCFLAGLFYPIGRPLERIVVTDATGTVWKRHFATLAEWGRSNGVDRVFVAWGSDTDEGAIGPSTASLVMLPSVVGPENLQHLEDGSADLVASLYQLAAGDSGHSRIAHQVLCGCWERIERRESARRPQAFGRLIAGTHQGPYLVGAVRALVETGVWKINEGCLRADAGGLYLQWPEAALDLIAFGRDRGYAGWPNEPATLAALLAAANVVEGRSSDLGMLEIVDEHGEIRPALKIQNALSVLDDFDPEVYAAKPATLAAVLERDPLAGAEANAASMQPASAAVTQAATQPVTDGAAVAASPPAAAPAAETAIAAATQPAAPAADTTVRSGADGTQPADGAPRTQTARTQALVASESVRVGGKLEEAPEVRYSDLVPPEVQSDLRNALHVELLGKIIKAWRDKGEANTAMRRVDNGAAIALTFLTEHMRDVPSWVDTMARAGLVYAPPATPGLRIQKVSIPEGKKAVEAVVLSDLACRRLGL